MNRGRAIPIAPIDNGSASGCSAAESFALMVLGDSMQPEFMHGDIVVVEPEGLVHDGACVIAMNEGEWILRQLVRQGEAWVLKALNPDFPAVGIADLTRVKGVVIQRVRPGRRRETKCYVK